MKKLGFKKMINMKNLLFVCLVVYASYIFVSQQVTMHEIKVETKAKRQELQKVSEVNQKLQDEVKMSQSDMYIEKLARERLHLIKEGETPVINGKK